MKNFQDYMSNNVNLNGSSASKLTVSPSEALCSDEGIDATTLSYAEWGKDTCLMIS